MDETVSGSLAEAENGNARLRVTHIFGVTAACAVVLAIRTALMGDAVDALALYNNVWTGIASLFHGSASAGFILLAWRWWSGRVVSLTRSGHCLLCLFASSLVISYTMAALMLIYRAQSTGSLDGYYAWNWEYLGSTLGGAICSFVFAGRIRGRWWKTTLVVSGMTLLVISALSLLALFAPWSPWYWRTQMILQAGLGLTMAIFGILGCRADQRDGGADDWLYWLGVGIFLTGAVFEALDGFYSLVRFG